MSPPGSAAERSPAPMLRSMTGFGAAALERGDLRARVEVRSVNHRHLQAKWRLPGDLARLESELDGQLRKALARGAVSVYVEVEDAAATSVQLDRELARRVHAELLDLGRELGTQGGLTLADLAALPGVLLTRKSERDERKVARVLREALAAALTDLLSMREHEGQALLKDLRKQARAIGSLRGRIAKRAPRLVQEQHENLRRRVRELVGEAVAVDTPELARELALLADKLDVSEELARLGAHLEQLETLLTKGGPVGRQLDFLAQEFLREANTIGSKCSDAATAHLVVDLKTVIERLREQVQNVE